MIIPLLCFLTQPVRPFGLGRPHKLKGISIAKEYALIKQKKSKLSASMRKMVVAEYERY